MAYVRKPEEEVEAEVKSLDLVLRVQGWLGA